jgi:hypothetical protein
MEAESAANAFFKDFTTKTSSFEASVTNTFAGKASPIADAVVNSRLLPEESCSSPLMPVALLHAPDG